MHGTMRSGRGNHGPGPGGGRAAGEIRSDGRAGWAAPWRAVSGMVSMRAVRRGGLGLLAAVVVVLSAQPAVLASSSPAADVDAGRHPRPARLPGTARRWPTTRPPATSYYSAAPLARGSLRGTWTWNGSTWTRQTPATSWPARGICLDGLRHGHWQHHAVLRPVALRGGAQRHVDLEWLHLDETGTQRLVPPPGRPRPWPTTPPLGTSFCSGVRATERRQMLNDTWTWDGTNWTRQFSARSPPPRETPRWPMTRQPATLSFLAVFLVRVTSPSQ